jgi:hypothetical protein
MRLFLIVGEMLAVAIALNITMLTPALSGPDL